MVRSKLSSIYKQLYDMRWPIIALRLTLVISIVLVIFGIAASLLVGAVYLAIFAVPAVYLFVLTIASFINILVGSANPKKTTTTLSMRNRTVSISALIMFAFVFQGEFISFFGGFASELWGILGIFLFGSLTFYGSCLAVSAMYLNDEIDGEAKQDLIFRRVLYVPPLIIRDFVIPFSFAVAGLILTYNSSMCLLGTSFRLIAANVYGALMASLLDYPDAQMMISSQIDNLGTWLQSITTKLGESEVGSSSIFKSLTPTCSGWQY